MADLLVLGGTSWLGGAVASFALAAGHRVTCLARGTSGSVPEGASLVVADRSGTDAYAALPRPAAYDLVVDVARQPGHVRGAVAALGERAGHWVLVSSCSVYARHDEHGADESAQTLPALEADEGTLEEYGSAKVACEQAVTRALGERALVARSGLIVGRGDLSERFGYWPSRFALAAQDGGAVLVPERLDAPVQWVDVLDLAAWLVTAGLAGTAGTFNAMGAAVTLGELLTQAAAVAGFTGSMVTVPDAALVAAGVEEFMGAGSLPLWFHDPQWSAFLDRATAAAAAAGLGQRPLADTLRDALEWERLLGLDRPRTRAGLDRATELELLPFRRLVRQALSSLWRTSPLTPLGKKPPRSTEAELR